eukprot:GDKK01069380.1.p1 GENE.GDKK01069380.1~~GDKK01069380.1.p1  ORF type:complete len:340 (+),score=98.06 GDKK01069380.1:208-1227(+)
MLLLMQMAFRKKRICLWLHSVFLHRVLLLLIINLLLLSIVHHDSLRSRLHDSSSTSSLNDSIVGENTGKLIAFKHFDDKEETFAGSIEDTKAVSDFVVNAGMRIFQEMGPENYKGYIDRGLPIAWLFVKPAEKENNEVSMTAYEAAAKEYKGKMSFVWVDASKYGGMSQRMGLKGVNFPAAVIDYQNKHFGFDESTALSAENIRKYFADYFAGTLKRSVRSQDAPAENPSKGLWTIVGTNFDEIVKGNAEYDVLIKFYAPWCGHCVRMQPTWEQLSEKVDENTVIAELDASAHSAIGQRFGVRGFPTLKFFPKNNKEGIAYSGARDLAGFEAYIQKTAQ